MDINQLNQLAKDLRRAAIRADDWGHDVREFLFIRWQHTTVFPQAVNRWVYAIGEQTK